MSAARSNPSCSVGLGGEEAGKRRLHEQTTRTTWDPQPATLALVAGSQPGLDVPAVLGGVGTHAAQALLSRPELSAAFVSIRRRSVGAVDEILKRAVLRSATSDQLERELRLHIVGVDAFPPHALLDRRRIGFGVLRAMGYDETPENLALVRKQAGQVAAKGLGQGARTTPGVHR